MPNGILIIDKPSGWTSMDVCAKLRGAIPGKWRCHFPGTPWHGTSSAEMNSACGKILGFAQNAWTPLLRRGRMPRILAQGGPSYA